MSTILYYDKKSVDGLLAANLYHKVALVNNTVDQDIFVGYDGTNLFLVDDDFAGVEPSRFIFIDVPPSPAFISALLAAKKEIIVATTIEQPTPPISGVTFLPINDLESPAMIFMGWCLENIATDLGNVNNSALNNIMNIVGEWSLVVAMTLQGPIISADQIFIHQFMCNMIKIAFDPRKSINRMTMIGIGGLLVQASRQDAMRAYHLGMYKKTITIIDVESNAPTNYDIIRIPATKELTTFIDREITKTYVPNVLVESPNRKYVEYFEFVIGTEGLPIVQVVLKPAGLVLSPVKLRTIPRIITALGSDYSHMVNMFYNFYHQTAGSLELGQDGTITMQLPIDTYFDVE